MFTVLMQSCFLQSGLVWSQDALQNEKLMQEQSEQLALIHKEDVHSLPNRRIDKDVLSLTENEVDLMDKGREVKDSNAVSDKGADSTNLKSGEAVENKARSREKMDSRGVNMIRRFIWMTLFYSSSN